MKGHFWAYFLRRQKSVQKSFAGLRPAYFWAKKKQTIEFFRPRWSHYVVPLWKWVETKYQWFSDYLPVGHALLIFWSTSVIKVKVVGSLNLYVRNGGPPIRNFRRKCMTLILCIVIGPVYLIANCFNHPSGKHGWLLKLGPFFYSSRFFILSCLICKNW